MTRHLRHWRTSGSSDLAFDPGIIPQQGEETTQEWVYRALRLVVMSGQIMPGQALTIRGLADMLDVSPMPVREALRRLTSEGALELKSNRRIVVPTLTPARLAELLEIRVALEGLAAQRAAPYINSDRIAMLRTIDNDINDALAQGDAARIILGNQAFHRTLYLANPHDACLPMIERIWLQLGPLHRLALTWLSDQSLDDRHVDIIAALERHDAWGLKVAVEADIREAAGFLAQQRLLQDYFAGETDISASEQDLSAVFAGGRSGSSNP